MRLEDRLFPLLRQVVLKLSPWHEHECHLKDLVASATCFLGGDGLRPYVCLLEQNEVFFVGVQQKSLPLPPLISEIIGGAYGNFSLRRISDDLEFYSLAISGSELLESRLNTPSVLLVGLGHKNRYGGLRLPLGIARLSQWLRFTHTGRVQALDYSITDQAENLTRNILLESRIDILGISVNFGQWQMLQDLAAFVENLSYVPLVVLGNILAAFSPVESARLFCKAPVLVAAGLGERTLEKICRYHDQPDAWSGIPGLLRPDNLNLSSEVRAEPPLLIFPDDGLVSEVIAAGGQVSLETSFGCQYGKCTFCPRSHRGDGWQRSSDRDVLAILERLSYAKPTGKIRGGPVLSFVDEEFFGRKGTEDTQWNGSYSASRILDACRELGIEYELYTRLEQLFDRRNPVDWNLSRARLLATNSGSMRRVFVGVESGSSNQLRRYGKGQSIAQIVDSLRVASMLQVPLEFGFITFDPLLSPSELLENLKFLARQDILMEAGPESIDERIDFVRHYMDGGVLKGAGLPIYTKVAYMATELEVLVQSSYAKYLQKRYPDLLDGALDPNFARLGVRYSDQRIQEIAGWCRVWTEGMFHIVYQTRMLARSSGDKEIASKASSCIREYRNATFGLLAGLACAWLPELEDSLSAIVFAMPERYQDLLSGPNIRINPLAYLQDLSDIVLEGSQLSSMLEPLSVAFDKNNAVLRRVA